MEDFSWWKADEGRINQSYMFGRDNPYAEPVVEGQKYVLRHVHVIPLASSVDMERWNAVWRRKGEKKSDRALIYASCISGYDYLLIHFLNEPGAHLRARKEMKMMRHFTRQALAFRDGDRSACMAA
ncbi:type II toxin-antitoxin system YafO family toxin [Xanthomonas arboricola]|uniref:type II toxin-antitoxin system YafO family toxin n=1 Tax=Xanthomonas arboricola TaxID=56448 RepID=UPI0013DF9F53|nr:type II toxin-antitoxin system YafO family toxin [Xanthomonas arboricola]